jgi:hypothetical protein
MLPRIGDHGDRFLVVARQNSDHVRPSTGAESHSFPDSKIQHGAVRPHLAEKSESSHDLVVQLDQVFFGEGVNIEVAHYGLFLGNASILHLRVGFRNPTIRQLDFLKLAGQKRDVFTFQPGDWRASQPPLKLRIAFSHMP